MNDHTDAGFDEANSLDVALREADAILAEPGVSRQPHHTFRLALDSCIPEYADRPGVSSELTLKAFLAANVEMRLTPTLSQEQRRRLAVLFHEVARGFERRRWPAYAGQAYRQAGELYTSLHQHGAVYECSYREERLRLYTTPPRQRWRVFPLYWGAGFGYRPYRLLYVSVVSTLLFAVGYRLIDATAFPAYKALSYSAMNYLAAVGFGDMQSANAAAQLLTIVQGVFSLVLNSTLFALLVRRWFRS
jgi:hypothetical protein